MIQRSKFNNSCPPETFQLVGEVEHIPKMLVVFSHYKMLGSTFFSIIIITTKINLLKIQEHRRKLTQLHD